MRKLPLYVDIRLPVQQAEPREVDPHCSACSLHRHAVTVCQQAAGEPGGVLFVWPHPDLVEDRVGRPFSSRDRDLAHAVVAEHWKGPVAHDYAVRCWPQNADQAAGAVESCRQYLAATIREVAPTRIIVMGQASVVSVLGQSLKLTSARRAVSWARIGDRDVPVFVLLDPEVTEQNDFLAEWWHRDLIWALTVDPDECWPPAWGAEVRLVETAAQAAEVLHVVQDAGGFTYDCEWSGRPADAWFELLCVSVVPYDTELTYCFTFEALRDPSTVEPLKRLLADPSIRKNGSNLKADHLAVRGFLDVVVEGTDFDVRLVRKLIHADASGYLDEMAFLVGMGGHKHEFERALERAEQQISKARQRSDRAAGFLPGTVDPILEHAVTTTLPTKQYAYGLVNRDLLYRYCSADALASERLRVELAPRLEVLKPVHRIWSKIVLGTTEAFAHVERWGVPISRPAVERYSQYLGQQIEVLDRQIQHYGVNLSSPQQVAALLYDKLRLRNPLERVHGPRSTNQAVLNAMREQHPIVASILQHRGLVKLKGSYADGLLEFIHADGRVHPSYLIDGAESGRSSATDPAIQTIPRGRNDNAKLARTCFTALPGWKIVQLDFSQQELRCAALLLGDRAMLQVFYDGVDYHQRTAELIAPIAWKILAEQVTKRHRSDSKTVTFGILYQKGAKSLARDLGCDEQQAARIMDAIFGGMPDLASWIEEQIAEAEQTGFVWTWWEGARARRRPVWPIGYRGGDFSGTQGNARRAAVNSPIQGCLPASTRVRTRLGMLPIGGIPTSGEVWTGHEWATYRKLNRGPCELAEIELANGQVLRCDTRHQVLVEGRNDYEFRDWSMLVPGDRVARSAAPPERTTSGIGKRYETKRTYATSAVVATRALGVVEETYTLAVDHPSHRFDSEGVISKNTANDYGVRSLVECCNWLVHGDLPAELIMFVHDALVFHAREDAVDRLADRAASTMLSWDSGAVPLAVDIEVGDSWGTLQKVGSRTGEYRAGAPAWRR